MLKQIHIQNFQKHRDLTLDLSPGVNFIIGSSDSGKTAIIRALKWLATNRPLGDGFVSWGSQKETVVEVKLDDGTSIIHGQGCYALAKGNKCQDWSAIGTTVPEAVTQALNLSELSWQAQMDAPFLLSASSGEVARTLNEVADLDKIDSSLININRMARDNRQQLTTAAQQKQQLEIELSAYRGLDDQLARVAQLKEMERKARLLEEMVANGSGLVASATEQEEALARYRNVEKNLEHVRQLNKQMADYETVGEGIGKGQRMLAEIRELTDRLKATKDPTDAEAELDLLLDMVGKSKEIDRDIEKIQAQLMDAQGKQVGLAQVAGMVERLEVQWHEQFPSVCPLCGRGD